MKRMRGKSGSVSKVRAVGLAVAISIGSCFAMLPAIASAEPDNTLVEVVAEGAGLDAESAMNSAYRAAVQQAVGMYIDSETLVRNNDLIRDEILTHSRGLIDSVDIISSSEEGGLHRVQIRAQVLQQPLENRIEPILSDSTSIRIDGASRLAAAASAEQQQQDAETLWNEALEQLQQARWFDFRIEGEPRVVDSNDAIEVDVRVDFNFEDYKKSIKRPLEIISQISGGHVETISLKTKMHSDDIGFHNDFSIPPRGFGRSKDHVFLVETWVSDNRLQRKWSVYTLPVDCPSNRQISSPSATVNVEVEDAEGNLVAMGFERFNQLPNLKSLSSRSICSLAHDIRVLNSGNVQFLEYPIVNTVSIPISPDELAVVDKVSLSAFYN